MISKNKQLVSDFISDIWNNSRFELIGNYLHKDFTDHSLPAALPPDKEGLIAWIKGTGNSFEHVTHILESVCENDHVIIRLKMNLKHTGAWRNIEATGKEIETLGFRHFRIKENRIVAHWALIDGNNIENQLAPVKHGCRI